jgi:hypothetical protein
VKIANNLKASFETFYHDLMGSKPRLTANNYFTPANAKAVAEAIEDIKEPSLILKLIGGKWFNEQVNTMFLFIETYKKSKWFVNQMFEVGEGKRKKEKERREKLQKKKYDDEEKRCLTKKKDSKRAADAVLLAGFKRS